MILVHLTVAVLVNPVKNPLFTVDERVEMLKEAASSLENVSVATFDGLMVEFARQQGVVPDLWMRVERQVAGIDRAIAAQEKIEFPVIGSGDRPWWVPEEAVVDHQEVNARVRRLLERRQAGVDGGADLGYLAVVRDLKAVAGAGIIREGDAAGAPVAVGDDLVEFDHAYLYRVARRVAGKKRTATVREAGSLNRRPAKSGERSCRKVRWRPARVPLRSGAPGDG